MKYFIIGDEDAVLGFSLVGVTGRSVSTTEQAEAAFKEAIADQDIGIILVTEASAELIRETVDRYVFLEQFPLVVEIQDRTGPLPGKLPLRQLVNKAIGISL